MNETSQWSIGRVAAAAISLVCFLSIALVPWLLLLEIVLPGKLVWLAIASWFIMGLLAGGMASERKQ